MPLLSFAVALAVQTAAIDPDTKKLFNWYESFHVSEYLKKPFVHFEGWNGEPWDSDGFLIGRDSSKVTILSTSLELVEFDLTVTGEDNYRVRIEPSNLQTYLRPWLDSIYRSHPTNRPSRDLYGIPCPTLAWICSKVGLNEDADRLMKLNRSWYGQLSHHFQGYIETSKDFAIQPIANSAVLQIENPRLSWLDLQRQFESLQTRYGDCPQRDEFAKIAKMAKELVDDQKSHIPNKDDVVAELIWGLPFYRFYGYFGSESVDDLEKIGLPAIPQLEEALNDNRPIRSLMHPTTGPRMSQDLHTIYRVKSAAMEAIERIAHQWFDGRTPEEKRANIDHWYHVAQTQGEQAALVANVRKGGQNSLDGASVLVEKYPDAAFAAIVAAYNESNESTRAELYKTLTRLHTKPDGLLRDIAKNGRETRLRVAALSILAEQAPQEALPLAIAKWQSLEDGAPSMETSDLIAILLRSQRPEALRALQSGLRKRPQSVRSEVVFQYDRDSIFHKFRGGVDAIPITDETRPVIEDLLASELDDDYTWIGTLTFDRVNLTLPKISTLVLFELSRLYPGAYSFKDSTSDADLDQQKKKAMKTHQLRVKERGGTNP